MPGKQADIAPQPAAATEVAVPAASGGVLVPLPGAPAAAPGEWMAPPVVSRSQRNAGNAAVTRYLGRQPKTKTAGERAMEAAHANWLDPAASVKDEVDVLKAALREIKRGKNVAYNKEEGKKNVAAALKVLGKTLTRPPPRPTGTGSRTTGATRRSRPGRPPSSSALRRR